MAKAKSALGHQAKEVLKDIGDAKDNKKLFKGSKKSIAEFLEWFYKSYNKGLNRADIDSLILHLTNDLDKEFLNAVYEESIDDDDILVDFDSVPPKIDNTFIKNQRILMNPFVFDKSELIKYSKEYEDIQSLLEDLSDKEAPIKEKFKKLFKDTLYQAVIEVLDFNEIGEQQKEFMENLHNQIIDCDDKDIEKIFNHLCELNPEVLSEELDEDKLDSMIRENLNDLIGSSENIKLHLVNVISNILYNFIKNNMSSDDSLLTEEKISEMVKVLFNESFNESEYNIISEDALLTKIFDYLKVNIIDQEEENTSETIIDVDDMEDVQSDDTGDKCESTNKQKHIDLKDQLKEPYNIIDDYENGKIDREEALNKIMKDRIKAIFEFI